VDLSVSFTGIIKVDNDASVSAPVARRIGPFTAFQAIRASAAYQDVVASHSQERVVAATTPYQFTFCRSYTTIGP
jgi:hypothetical protein